MSVLNEKSELTEKVIHLMITSLCDRNCKYCCNKQYDLNDIPYVTDDELKKCKMLFITGGEPFAYGNPLAIAAKYKKKYPNINKIIVYTNAYELREYLKYHDGRSLFENIDGVNISIKNKTDLSAFDNMVRSIHYLIDPSFNDNRLYVFDDLMPENTGNCVVFKREWQKEFNAASDSIFRKV